MSLAAAAAMRFPQPVRVGDLLQREVLRPIERQPVLGRVFAVVRRPDGGIEFVVNYGGWFGFLRRPIAVPIDAMVLLGEAVEIIGISPEELAGFKTFDPTSATPLPPDSIIHVGLAKPSH